jgi:sec-independent protein translocase protein TatA
MGLSWQHILVVILIIVVLFGAKRIPEIMKGLGEGVKEFKKAARDVQDETDAGAKKTDEKKDEPKKLNG